MLAGYVGQAFASKVIIEEPCSMLPEAPLHGTCSLLESCTPVAAASQHRGELGLGRVWLLLEKVEQRCFDFF
jgi:hypothetical protein